MIIVGLIVVFVVGAVVCCFIVVDSGVDGTVDTCIVVMDELLFIVVGSVVLSCFEEAVVVVIFAAIVDCFSVMAVLFAVVDAC